MGGGEEGGCGVKNFFIHPYELLILAYSENLVKIGLLVEAVKTFSWTNTGRDRMEHII